VCVFYENRSIHPWCGNDTFFIIKVRWIPPSLKERRCGELMIKIKKILAALYLGEALKRVSIIEKTDFHRSSENI
jgi:hypothetical protein